METTTIRQTITFKNTTPAELYQFYINEKLHSSITGYPAEIQPIAQTSFKLCGDYLFGKNLLLLPNKLIVQSMKAKNWEVAADFSVLVLEFKAQKGNTQLNLTQVGVPQEIAKNFKQGWSDWYWKAWKKQLKLSATAS